MITWTDTHAHIYSKQFDADRADTVQRAAAAGVEHIFMPNIDEASIDAMLDAESRYPACKPMMGLHPCYVQQDFQQALYTIESWLDRRKFLAIGEIGTDLYWDRSSWAWQQEAFTIQLGWALRYQLPVVIHCRNSMDETLDLLKPFEGKGLTGIFHCFTGTKEQLHRVLAAGFHIGVGGVSTFRNGGLDQVLPGMDPTRLVLETDCPYLAPIPHRGKRNEPCYLPLVAARVAQLMGISVEALSAATNANWKRLFPDLNLDGSHKTE